MVEFHACPPESVAKGDNEHEYDDEHEHERRFAEHEQSGMEPYLPPHFRLQSLERADMGNGQPSGRS